MTTFTVESYDRPPPGFYFPPGPRRIGISWPTGFAGGGYLVRDSSGAVVSAHAWRYDALAWVARQESAQEHASGTDFDLEGRS